MSKVRISLELTPKQHDMLRAILIGEIANLADEVLEARFLNDAPMLDDRRSTLKALQEIERQVRAAVPQETVASAAIIKK